MSTQLKQAVQLHSSSKITLREAIYGTLIIFLVLTVLVPFAYAQAPAQMTFATPDDAAIALWEGFKSNDLEKLSAIFGPNAQEDFSSGDPIADKNDREVMAAAMGQSWRWAPRGTKEELVIGEEAWPFPVPLVKIGARWQFDSKAGAAEVLARRVGRNELAVIDLCKAYVLMQQAYANQPHDEKKAGLYAEKFQSTPEQQDGLYWSVNPGEQPSPLGDLAAEAAAGGYEREKTPKAPFMGYYFRILTAQGPAASGGAKSYIVNGDMSGGFALIAYPAKYASSGVMTFIVNQSGVVYEKDLGPETSKIATGLNEYNPDHLWKKVRVP
jgi:hypothetical protein